ncbi:reverse transcriptase-like protein [Neobacillus dielmonensis]|uniref:reverse transcriptase-like protein n=1 Tax=Neobacillus dielmonensis TaxID=1347369 RepID=UPI0005A8D87D|nr:reverse transcriptase-like protein [Neobacillus dielmonensis]
MNKTTHPSPPIALLLKAELREKTKLTKTEMNACLADGMPHYMIGNEYRFLETEVVQWLKTYRPSQERLEKEFIDKKGRTLQEYVTQEVILETLRIKKENLAALLKKGMPFAKVGEKNFYHIQDILDFYRRGSQIHAKQPQTRSSKKKFLMPLCRSIPKEVPFIIMDGSYNFNKHQAGTGLVLIENRDIATGRSNVWNMKTTKPIICEYLALLEALKLIKDNNFTKAVVITDQESWCKGITFEIKTFEETVKPVMTELTELWGELRGKVTIKFVGQMDKGNQNSLYKKAHDLSRAYKKAILENLEFG